MLKLYFMMAMVVLPLLCHAENTCPNLSRAKPIIMELGYLFKSEICQNNQSSLSLKQFSEQFLPLMMKKDFLGVEPPLYWQALAKEIVDSCNPNSNLCLRKTQEDLANCLGAKLPGFLLVVGPWFTENCQQLNVGFISNWNEKRKLVKDWFTANNINLQ